jgi:hypothetical protein
MAYTMIITLSLIALIVILSLLVAYSIHDEDNEKDEPICSDKDIIRKLLGIETRKK